MFCNLSTTARITSQRNVGRGKCVACDCSYSCGETHDDKTDKKEKKKEEIVANCATATPMQTFLDTSLNSFACDAMREPRDERRETVPRWTDTRSFECQNVPATPLKMLRKLHSKLKGVLMRRTPESSLCSRCGCESAA